MKLEWVNHASFIVEHRDVRLIGDPWLGGRVFADGWGLLSEGSFTADDFASVSHLWFSHEHPDHFHPPSLRTIPSGVRELLPVMIQETPDHKVVNWCRAHGFKDVSELKAGEWVELSPDVRVMCQPARFDDSWLAVEAGDQLLLNLNDCILDTEERMQEVMDLLPRPVDVLLLQYSYSARVANRGDDDRFRKETARILRNMTMMTRVADPTYVIPFASYVWFCHEENAYMNAGVTTPRRAYEHLRDTTSAEPIVLYPGDRWTVGDVFDSGAALDRYEADLASVLDGSRARVQPRQLDYDELAAKGAQFRRALFAAHGTPLRWASQLRAIPPTTVYLEDLGRAATYSLADGLMPSDTPREACDCALSGDALAYMFEHMWGGETLKINGRFEIPPRGSHHRFERYITLGDLANHGHSYWRHRLRHLVAATTRAGRRLSSRMRQTRR